MDEGNSTGIKPDGRSTGESTRGTKPLSVFLTILNIES